ncbi:MFS transporter [Streptomyces sp. NPDC049954]|uniref:MFS transporter n=1 Tax=Streptomyces sp. NPDC049954 TaxID=3155779 RepID=UPI00343E6525
MTGPGEGARHPLREAPFARLWVSGLLTETGRWVLQLALPLYVLALTRSPLVTSVVAMLGLLPSLVVAPLAGALVDRFDRRRFLIVVSLAQAAALTPLLWVEDAGDLWRVYLVAGAEAVLTMAFESVKNVALPAFVAPGQLVSANAAIGLNASLGRLVGSSLGGLLLGWAGLRLVLGSAMAAFLVAAVLAATIPRATGAHEPGGAGRGELWPGLRDALRAIREVPALRGTFQCVALLSLAQGMFVVLFLLFVTDLLGAGEAEAGLLRGVQAVGGFAGTVTVGVVTRRLGAPRLLSVGVLCFGAVSAVTWNLSQAPLGLTVYAALFALAGVPAVWLMAAWLSLVQQSSPPRVRGRVMACVLGLADGLQAVGMLAAGLLTGVMSPLAALDLQAALLLAAGLLTLRTLPAGRSGATAGAPADAKAAGPVRRAAD